MARDNVTFRFRIDLKDMTIKGKQAAQILDELARKSGNASTGFDRMGASAGRAGQQTAASAVNFQTATQGMLNLSTAAVQTFTSISNLDRANNRAKQSIIAVARAEDLLNNKKQRANEMSESGITSGMKYANIQREIATAEADLAVKIEKRGIEQAAVNDIYMLFATNIANVTISSMQTIVILLGHERSARLASAAATNIQRIASLDATKATIAQTSATVLQGKAAVITTGATLGLAGSIRVAAAAMKSFMGSNPILLAAMAASTAALIIYEQNWFGVKDAVNEALGVHDDFQETVDELRNSQDKYNDSLENTQTKTQSMPESFRKMKDAVKEYRTELLAATIIQNQVITDAQVLQGVGIATQISQTTSPPLGNGGKTPDFSIFGFSLFPSLPTAHGQTQGPFQRQGPGIGPLARSFTDSDMQDKRDKFDTMLFILEQKSLELDKKVAGIINTQILSKGGVPKRLLSFPGLENILGVRSELLSSDELQQLPFVKDRQLPSFISKAISGGAGDIVLGIDPKRTAGRIFDGIALDPETQKNIALSQLNRNIAIPQEGGRTLFDFLAKTGRVGKSTILDTNLVDVIEQGGVRGEVAFLTGFDIGQVANSLPKEEALRLAQVEKGMSFFANTRGGQTGAAAVFLAQNGGASPSVAKGLANLGTIKAYETALNQGLISATAAYQVTRGSIRVDPIFATRRAIRDNNASRLKTGGTRLVDEFGVPLFDLADERAVEGGFTSLSAYRADAREEFFRKGDQAQGFLDLLGIGKSRSFRAGSAAVVHRKIGKAIAQAQDSRSLLQRTGLSLTDRYRGTNGRGYKTWIRFNEYTSFRGAADARARLIEQNQITLKRAGQIDLLHGGFGLGGFFGSGAPLQSLQDEVARQDNIISTIGLNRTEAFQIIDTQGRGRTEIDDRYRWSQRLSIISTGNSVV